MASKKRRKNKTYREGIFGKKIEPTKSIQQVITEIQSNRVSSVKIRTEAAIPATLGDDENKLESQSIVSQNT